MLKKLVFVLLLVSLVTAVDFNITSTDDFDDGLKSNIETNSDYNAVSANEINLKLGTVYSNNFEYALH